MLIVVRLLIASGPSAQESLSTALLDFLEQSSGFAGGTSFIHRLCYRLCIYFSDSHHGLRWWGSLESKIIVFIFVKKLL